MTAFARRTEAVETQNPTAGTVVDLTGRGRKSPVAPEPTPDGPPRWAEVMPRVTVIIPAYNEAENLPHVLPSIPGWVQEVILVDGHSTDGTVEVARSLLPSITVVEQPGRGKGDAMEAGFRAATGEIIASLDADGSMDPNELHVMVGELMAGADFVKGSRFVQGAGTDDIEWYRRLGNRVIVWFCRLLFGSRYTDLCYGYVAFWREALERLAPDADGFEIEALLGARALRRGLRVAETPSFEAHRLYGSSHLRTFRDGWRVLRTLLAERFRRETGGPS